jgi:hypothetical protein
MNDIGFSDSPAQSHQELHRFRDGIGHVHSTIEHVRASNAIDHDAVELLVQWRSFVAATDDPDIVAPLGEPGREVFREALDPAHVRSEVRAHEENTHC